MFPRTLRRKKERDKKVRKEQKAEEKAKEKQLREAKNELDQAERRDRDVLREGSRKRRGREGPRSVVYTDGRSHCHEKFVSQTQL